MNPYDTMQSAKADWERMHRTRAARVYVSPATLHDVASVLYRSPAFDMGAPEGQTMNGLDWYIDAELAPGAFRFEAAE